MKPQHQAIAAGLALTLAFGTAATPSTVFASTDTDSEDALVATGGSSADGTDTGSDEAVETSGELPAPADFDRADGYEEDPAAEAEAQGMPSIMMLSVNSLMASRAMSIQPTSLSSEMKYFAENESGSNYNQGFSFYDGYNAMGFYQFDRRYSLVEFMEACYAYDPETYAMFAPVIERGDELRTGAIYDSTEKRLTEIGQLAQDAWHAAYAANPSEFSALQDDFAYQEYYLPVERILRNTFGVDISGRADCVKGLAWGMCNLFGSGGCQKYFKLAELTDDMSDREFVNALCDAIVENVGGQWAGSYRARYERERATCLEYIAEDEAQNDAAGPDGDGEQPPANDDQQADGNDQGTEDGGDQDGDEGDGLPDPGDDGSADGGSSPDSEPVPPSNGPVIGGASGDDAGSDSDNGASDDSGNGSGGNGAESDPSGGSNADTGNDEGDGSDDGVGGSSGDGSGDSSSPDAGGDSNGAVDSEGDGSGDSGSDSDAESAIDSSTGDSSPTDADKNVPTDSQGGAGSNDTSSDDDSKSDDKKDEAAEDSKKDERAATVDEREKLPATADAASIGLAVSAGLSAIGAGAAVIGKKGRGPRIPFEDGFRE